MRKVIVILLLTLVGRSFSQQTKITPAPTWAKDLIIYELATKGFTSPAGAETGTFRSTMERIPYLKDLGINGVWLTGHNWADEDHFYGIWTQYATIRPDSIDPSLGTPLDFKLMINEFHKYGIKVFLDIITHGVMDGSPLIKEHPEWFRGGSWGMVDYDWEGNRNDLDEWWVKTHVDYVLKYGIDGYRLDVDIYRPDLWKKVKQQCADAGHPIVVWTEGEKYNDGACDFYQRQTTLSLQISGIDTNNIANSSIGDYFASRTTSPAFYFVKVFYNDGSVSVGNSFNSEQYTHYICNQLWWLLNMPLHRDLKVVAVENKNAKTILKLSNLKTGKEISKVSVNGFNLWEEAWRNESKGKFQLSIAHNGTMDLVMDPAKKDTTYYSIQLSSHDDGWETFPANANPYVAEGSRCTFGYSCMLTPSIPIFMSGEEFNATYKALPRHTPDLYGKGEKGKGTWLYASWIQWNQLKEKNHADMLTDVKKMISIRKAESDIFYARMNNEPLNILALEYSCEQKIPTPYILWNDKKAIIVAGNNSDKDIKCSIIIPYEKMGKLSIKKANDIWNDKPLQISDNKISFTIKKDKSLKGGIIIIRLD